ncbi:MAG: hypothetical protein H6Q67_1455 [Firmicutes bacterium]|nr:hypothetical protein [Bacillota bacterium]
MSYMQNSKRNLRQEQAAETRQKLLNSAKMLFAEKGYNGTSVRSINRELNMSDGILYHYFPGGKREILSVILQESFAERLQKLNAANPDIENLPLREALHKIYMLCDELFSGDLELIKILFRESDLMDLKETNELSHLFQERLKWFSEFLSSKHQKGEIRNMDFEMAAKQFMSIGIVSIINKLFNFNFIGDLSRESYRERFIDYILDLWKTS